MVSSGLAGSNLVSVSQYRLAFHLTLAVAIYFDRKHNRLRWPLPLAFAWFTLIYATQWPMMNAQWYDSLARSIAALG